MTIDRAVIYEWKQSPDIQRGGWVATRPDVKYELEFSTRVQCSPAAYLLGYCPQGSIYP